MTRRPPYEPWRETAGEFRWRLGVRPLDLERWIEIDDDAAHELALKAEIMSSHPSTAFCALENTEDEAQEVLEVLIAHLEEVHPSHAATVKVLSLIHI